MIEVARGRVVPIGREDFWRRQEGQEAALVLALVRLQRKERLTDAVFAARLGVAQPTWTRVANGDRPVGFRLLAAAVKTYPQLSRRAVAFLRSDIHIRESYSSGERGDGA